MKMSLQLKKELIKKVKDRYLISDKLNKGNILNELGANTEMNRKYLTGRLSPKIDLDFVNLINRKETVQR